jgi:hypothetical protein
LERRTTRSGRDSVDHGTGAGASDDFANAMVCALASLQPRYGKGMGVFEWYRQSSLRMTDPVAAAAAGAPAPVLRDEDFGCLIGLPPEPRPIKFRVPCGMSAVMGIDGKPLQIDVDGTISATKEEASGFRRLGWAEEVA